jgi:histidinol-phosphate aminotransferase
MITAVPHIAAMAAYPRVETEHLPGKRLVRLDQNESYRPASPHALEAATAALATSHLYSESECTELRAAIAEVHGLNAETILCSAGSMEMINALCQVFTGPGRRVLTTRYAYAYLATTAAAAHAERDVVDEINLTVSVDNILTAVTGETAMVFVANPGNPTGTWLPRSEIVRLREGLPQDVLLVVDEAYGEFAEDGDAPVFDLVDRGNTVVLRTFSKAYGLAGARVGWGVFPQPLANEMRKVLNPGGISGVSQAAATAAMADQDYMHRTCRETARLREAFAARLRGAGLQVADSNTNFVLISFADEHEAGAADAALRGEGVLLRRMAGYGLPHTLRATIGTEEDMGLTARLLEDWAADREQRT